ncbi:hypothetical protein IE81DRAFT_301880 [Ceraceosorus guamensis]|uniref:Actin cytoskeleton-regulatory complex protein SLA1 n=1 Tax=Ceraceosorus guamensis TaxID=1522189 RepID=A0A316VYP9_9BASI|nr:hypothetical protein IE81DRAFT_301880 [Ceraceosorus guamensis]PWN42572.1 hypothetical protein IE81DRAFT_301880 [Ceraceosorus guamensis]
MAYVSLSKALYDYAATAEDELNLKEDDLLYIIDASDTEWWKAKLKTGPEDEEKIGLVPANYVEEAEPLRQSRALYDYSPQTEEELEMKEDQLLSVYEDDDDDWLLVRIADSGAQGKLGFVPKNYVDEVAAVDGATSLGAPISAGAAATFDGQAPEEAEEEVEEERQSIPATFVPPPAGDKSDEIKMWGVSALDAKKKKRKGTLGIGNGNLFFASESDKQPVQKFSVLLIESHALESKGKQINLELHEDAGVEDNMIRFVFGSKSEGEEVAQKLEESKSKAIAHGSSATVKSPSPAAGRSLPPPIASAARPAASPAAAALPPPSRNTSTLPPPARQTASASPATTPARNGHAAKEACIALYDFEAQGDDELSVAENEKLTLVERENEDWWKVRNASGSEGVVPASYIELSDGEDGDEAASSTQQDEAEREKQEKAAAAMEATRRTQEAAARRAREAEERREEEERRREALKAQPAPAPPRAAPSAVSSASATRAARDVSVPSGKGAPERPTDSAQAKSRPNPARTRNWVDRTGQFKVEAEFLGFNQGKIRLHKLNGVIIEVAIEKMSNADIQYLEDVTGKRLTPSSTSRGADSSTRMDPRSAGRERDRDRQREREREQRRRQAQRDGPKRNIDWFEFFLAAGVDVDNCTRYAAAFERDNIDESILADIESSTLRSLGLREGDIIRVDKFIKRKYKRPDAAPSTESKEAAQIRADEEMARKLQENEQSARRGASNSPAPNLFSGPDGSLRNNTRRGRPAPKTNGSGSVDPAGIAAAAEGLARTVSPPTRASTASPTVVRKATHPTGAGGFDDDAWTPRPSSTQPSTPGLSAAAPKPASVPPTPPPAPVPAAAPAPTPPTPPAAAPAPAVVSPPPTAAAAPPSDPNSALFDKLAAMKPPSAGLSPRPGASPANGSYLSGYNPNAPRGPLAPVPGNQGLLSPLVPTSGTGQFVPTSGLGPQATGYNNGYGGMQPQQTGYMQPQQTGYMQQQPQQTGYMQPQQTGYGMGMSMGMSSPGMMSQPTGYNPQYGISNVSGFGGGMLAPQTTAMPQHQQQQQHLQPQATGIQMPMQTGPNDKLGAASIFGQMKQGTLHQDSNSNPQSAQRYDALRPQPTGFAPGGVMGSGFQGNGMYGQQSGWGGQY